VSTAIRVTDPNVNRGSDAPGIDLPIPTPPRAAAGRGVVDVLPVVFSVMPFALVIGVAIARTAEVGGVLGVLASAGYYSGSAELASVGMVADGAGVVAVLGTTSLVNARLMVYGASLQPRFRDQPGWFRWLAPHFVIDQTYAIVSRRDDLGSPERFRAYWLAAGGTLGVGWLSTITAGIVLGPVLPDLAALEFAVPAVFLALLVPQLRTVDARRPAAVAAVGAVAAAPLPHGVGLLAGVVAGFLPALLSPGRTR
jgi:predicted branched-subunit amino acid permease